MYQIFIYMFLQIIIFHSYSFGNQLSDNLSEKTLSNWKKFSIVPSNQKKQSKTAILIISPRHFSDGAIENRWEVGKVLWENYMNSHPDVDCFFVVCTNPKKDSQEQVWLEDNTIYVGSEWTEQTGLDQILYKTIKSLEWLDGKYTHFIRTNINTFFNLKAVVEFAETHHTSFYSTPLWQGEWYTIGYGIIFTADIGEHIVNEYNRLSLMGEELISPFHSDDCALTALATGVWPLTVRNPFRCSKSLQPGVRQILCNKSLKTRRLSRYGALLSPVSSLTEAINNFDQADDTVFLFRTKDGLKLHELMLFYEYAFNKIYPELDNINWKGI